MVRCTCKHQPISRGSPLWNVNSSCHRIASDLPYIILCLGRSSIVEKKVKRRWTFTVYLSFYFSLRLESHYRFIVIPLLVAVLLLLGCINPTIRYPYSISCLVWLIPYVPCGTNLPSKTFSIQFYFSYQFAA